MLSVPALVKSLHSSTMHMYSNHQFIYYGMKIYIRTEVQTLGGVMNVNKTNETYVCPAMAMLTGPQVTFQLMRTCAGSFCNL